MDRKTYRRNDPALIAIISIGLMIGVVLGTYRGVLVTMCIQNNETACIVLGVE